MEGKTILLWSDLCFLNFFTFSFLLNMCFTCLPHIKEWNYSNSRKIHSQLCLSILVFCRFLSMRCLKAKIGGGEWKKGKPFWCIEGQCGMKLSSVMWWLVSAIRKNCGFLFISSSLIHLTSLLLASTRSTSGLLGGKCPCQWSYCGKF